MAKALELSKKAIVRAAVKMVNETGWDSLNARSLAKTLEISTKPLYRIYNNMDEIKEDVLIEIKKQYDEFINSKIDNKNPLLSLCISYTQFANDYKNLFISMFLSNNLNWNKIEDVFDEKWNQSTIINLVNKHGFSFDEAKEFAVTPAHDMAVGVIIGSAFGKIVTSLVDNILMPLIIP